MSATARRNLEQKAKNPSRPLPGTSQESRVAQSSTGHARRSRRPSAFEPYFDQLPTGPWPEPQQLDVQWEEGFTPPPTRISIQADSRFSRHTRQKHRQAIRWERKVLPTLLRPFMLFKRDQSTHSPPSPSLPGSCTCGTLQRLDVLLVSSTSVEEIQLSPCPHQSAPRLLIEMGYFACSPVNPQAAFNLDMLEFCSELFVHAAPNERAWALTLTKHLESRGYTFAAHVCLRSYISSRLPLICVLHKDSLRRRFGSALAQYQVLIQLLQAEIHRIVDSVRDSADNVRFKRLIPVLDEKTPISDRLYSNANYSNDPPTELEGCSCPHVSPWPERASDGMPGGRVACSTAASAPTQSSTPSNPVETTKTNLDTPTATILPGLKNTRTQPSSYLRRLCPLCFGGLQTCKMNEP